MIQQYGFLRLLGIALAVIFIIALLFSNPASFFLFSIPILVLGYVIVRARKNRYHQKAYDERFFDDEDEYKEKQLAIKNPKHAQSNKFDVADMENVTPLTQEEKHAWHLLTTSVPETDSRNTYDVISFEKITNWFRKKFS